MRDRQQRGLRRGGASRRIMLGAFALSSGYYDAYYNQSAASVKALIKQGFDACFEKFDVISC